MDLSESFNATLGKLRDQPFSTLDFIELYKMSHPEEWKKIVSKYGEGGRGQGSYYTSFVFVGGQLNKLKNRGILNQTCSEAPERWGNGIISVWNSIGASYEIFSLTDEVSGELELNSGIDDIPFVDAGNDDPEYRKRMSGSYVRVAGVRKAILKRANGICEECGQQGFIKKSDNQPYLETHHVISLSEQGADKQHNVIALCANDHRRAHYAENWAELQDKFLAKLSQFKTES